MQLYPIFQTMTAKNSLKVFMFHYTQGRNSISTVFSIIFGFALKMSSSSKPTILQGFDHSHTLQEASVKLISFLSYLHLILPSVEYLFIDTHEITRAHS